MAHKECNVCLDLNKFAIDKLRPTETVIRYNTLQGSAKECLYCRVILDGIEVTSFDRDAKVFSRSAYGTFRLTAQNLIGASGIESTVEYYLQDDSSGNRGPQNDQSSGPVPPHLDAIRIRPTIVQFWEETLRRQLLQWIREPPKSTMLPKRVVDLGVDDGDLRRDLRLLETDGESAAYVALSHCWVNRDILTTSRSSLAAHLMSIPFSAIPLAFQEASMVCRWLGVRYLWIDSLCILQGDWSDWEDQASNMDSIYENAFFSIAAHGHAGGLGSIIPSPKEYEIPTRLPYLEKKIRVRRIPVHSFLSPVGPVIEGIGEKAPDEISGRGWCYQERILSSQILHLTPFEVLHEDRTGRIRCQCSDSHSFFLLNIRRPSLEFSKDPSRLWRTIVEQYSQKAFTCPWDILPGLAGIARRFHRDYPFGQYLAGLWYRDLARWLCWKSVRTALWGAVRSGCERCGVWPRQLPEPPPRENYIVPSFSWASKAGACSFLESVWASDFKQVMQIRQIQMESAQENPFGRVTACSIQLRGLVLDMEVLSTVNKDRKYVQGCRTEYAYLVFPGVLPEAQRPASSWYESVRADAVQYEFDTIDAIPQDGRSVKVFEMFQGVGSSVCLVLRGTGSGRGRTGRTYCRIGICTMPYQSFNTASEEDLVFV